MLFYWGKFTLILNIGRKKYVCNSAMVTLLRYRKEFKTSYLRDCMGDAALAAMRLLWASIDGDKPDFVTFLSGAVEVKDIAEKALQLQADVLAVSGDAVSKSSGGEELDELDVLALMSVCGIDMNLIYELPVFSIVSVITSRNKMMNGRAKETTRYRKMNPAEVRELYGR